MLPMTPWPRPAGGMASDAVGSVADADAGNQRPHCPSALTCNASKGTYQIMPSGTMTSSSNFLVKSACEPFRMQSRTSRPACCHLPSPSSLQRQLVIRPGTLPMSRSRAVTMRRQLGRRAELPQPVPLAVQEEGVAAPAVAGGDEDQQGVSLGQRPLDVGRAPQGREDQPRRLAAHRHLPQHGPPAAG